MAPSDQEAVASALDDASENTPLLRPDHATRTNGHPIPAAPRHISASAISDADRPLPKLQIFLLCLVRLAEPISFFSIFPFVNQMVATNGSLPPESVGFYSGLIESLFSLTQMLVMVFWGRASDRFGRKPVLVLSLAGMSVSVAAFGFARSIWQMVLLRCLAGIFAGSVVTVRTMVGEQSTLKTQARAYSWYAVAGNLGIFLGPLMGGALAEPAKQYGGWFKDVRFFVDFPYALSTFMTGVFAVLCTIIAALFVEETLKGKRKADDISNGTEAADGQDPQESETPGETKSASIMQLLKSPGVPIVLLLYGHCMLLAFAYTALSPLYQYTPIPQGGYGFSEVQISIFMSVTGAAQAVWLLGVFPPLQKRIGTRGVMRWCGIAYPFFLATPPLIGFLRWNHSSDTEITFWVIGPVLLAIGVGVSMAFTACQLCLNLVSPSTDSLGTLNSLALALISGIRAFTPVLFSSIFAASVKEHILGGQFVWLLLVILAALFGLGTRWLPDKTDDREKLHDAGDS